LEKKRKKKRKGTDREGQYLLSRLSQVLSLLGKAGGMGGRGKGEYPKKKRRKKGRKGKGTNRRGVEEFLKTTRAR